MTPYQYGEPITTAEYRTICGRFFPGKHIKLQPALVLKGIHARFPMRLEHEVNRLRRWAFDAGDEGFSYERIDTCPVTSAGQATAPASATPTDQPTKQEKDLCETTTET